MTCELDHLRHGAAVAPRGPGELARIPAGPPARPHPAAAGGDGATARATQDGAGAAGRVAGRGGRPGVRAARPRRRSPGAGPVPGPAGAADLLQPAVRLLHRRWPPTLPPWRPTGATAPCRWWSPPATPRRTAGWSRSTGSAARCCSRSRWRSPPCTRRTAPRRAISSTSRAGSPATWRSGAQALLALAVAPPGVEPAGAEGARSGADCGCGKASNGKANKGLAASQLNRSGLKAGAPAPAFRLPRLDGGELALEDYRGRRVLLVFSDPECGPCERLAPELERLHRRRPDLAVLMVSRRDPEANRRKVGRAGADVPGGAAEELGGLDAVRRSSPRRSAT